MSDEPASPPASGRLLELAVTDLALLERVRIRFADGLNVLTGETGAGKSLLIDALGLALGARADPGLVRHGAETARVEALFDRLPEPLVCVREVAASGRSLARIDDDTVTAGRLAATAGLLVEIHGQHEQARLLDERWQRDLLDAYGGHAAERTAVADGSRRLARERGCAGGARRRPAGARAPDRAGPARGGRDHRRPRIRPGEVAEIQARLAASRHGAAIARGTLAIVALLSGDEADDAIAGARVDAARAAAEAVAIGRLDPRFGPLAARLEGLAAELEDVAFEARSLAEGVEHDPAALAALEERLSQLFTLERKYGTDADGLLGRAERAAAEVERLRGLGAERGRRSAEAARLLEVVAAAAGRLSARRQDAAAMLAAAVEAALAELGLGGREDRDRRRPPAGRAR